MADRDLKIKAPAKEPSFLNQFFAGGKWSNSGFLEKAGYVALAVTGVTLVKNAVFGGIGHAWNFLFRETPLEKQKPGMGDGLHALGNKLSFDWNKLIGREGRKKPEGTAAGHHHRIDARLTKDIEEQYVTHVEAPKSLGLPLTEEQRQFKEMVERRREEVSVTRDLPPPRISAPEVRLQTWQERVEPAPNPEPPRETPQLPGYKKWLIERLEAWKPADVKPAKEKKKEDDQPTMRL